MHDDGDDSVLASNQLQSVLARAVAHEGDLPANSETHLQAKHAVIVPTANFTALTGSILLRGCSALLLTAQELLAE